MSSKPWNEIEDTPTIDIGDKIGVFRTTGVTTEDKFKLLLLSQIRSTPENTHYVTNQEEIEDALGTNLIIPAGESITFVFNTSVDLTKPFKMQDDSSLLIKADSIGVELQYQGDGAMFQVDGVGVIPRIAEFRNITLSGNTLNDCFALGASNFIIVDFCVLQVFARIGFFEKTGVSWNGNIEFFNKAGMSFINCSAISFSNSGGREVNSTLPQTLFSFVGDEEVITVIFQNASFFAPDNHHELLFVDPNLPAGSFFTVRDSGVTTTVPASLFQKGVDVAITEVEGNGNGKIRCTAISHGQINGTYAVLSGFSEDYNKTSLIEVVDANTFDAVDIDFNLTDTGTINRASLDSTSPRVSATSNPNQRDSMFIASAGLESFAAPVVSSVLIQNQIEVINSVNWIFNNLERFAIGVQNEGQLVAEDVSTREYAVTYSGTIGKTGGSSGDIGIIILKNGIEVAFNPPHSVNTGSIQINGDDLIELLATDNIQVAVKNYSTTETAIESSQISLVISKG